MKSGTIRLNRRPRPLGCSRPSICTSSSLTSIPPIPMPPMPPMTTRSTNPTSPPLAERVVEGIGLHRRGDPASGADGVELVHEDHCSTEALRELAGLREEAHHPEVGDPHEHVVEAGGRGVDEWHVHLARYRFTE